MNVIEEIEKLAKLRDRGVISDEEHQELKAQILGTEIPSSVDDKGKDSSSMAEVKAENKTENIDDNADTVAYETPKLTHDNVSDKASQQNENLAIKGIEKKPIFKTNTIDANPTKPKNYKNITIYLYRFSLYWVTAFGC